MIFRIFRNIILLLIGITAPLFVIADDDSVRTVIYGNNCILAGDFNTSTSDELAVRTVNDICFRRCRDECKTIFTKQYDPFLNHDIYSQCMTSCKKGDLFTSGVRQQVGGQTDWVREGNGTIKRLSTRVKCSNLENPGGSDRADMNIYKTKFSPCKDDGGVINCPDQYKVKLMSPPGFANNEIFLCGNKSIKITPSYRSMNPEAWVENRDRWINRDDNPETWSARNPYFTDTGINIKDDGFLNIRYTGQYRYDAKVDPEEGFYSYHYEKQYVTAGPESKDHYDYVCKCKNSQNQEIDCRNGESACNENVEEVMTFGYVTRAPSDSGPICIPARKSNFFEFKCSDIDNDSWRKDDRCGSQDCSYKYKSYTDCGSEYQCINWGSIRSHGHHGEQMHNFCTNCRSNNKLETGWIDWPHSDSCIERPRGKCRGGLGNTKREKRISCSNHFNSNICQHFADSLKVRYKTCRNFYRFHSNSCRLKHDPAKIIGYDAHRLNNSHPLGMPRTVKKTRWNVTKPAEITKSFYREKGRGMNGHKLMIKDLNDSQNQNVKLLPEGKDLIWEEKLPNSQRFFSDQVIQYNDQISWYGLRASTRTQQAYGETLGSRMGDSDYYSNTVVTSSDLDVMHDFRGILGKDGNSLTNGRWVRLGIRHFDINNADTATFEGGNNWGDNLGGYEVDIEWKGCPYFDGDRLQYAIVFDDIAYSNISWHDVSRDVIIGKEPLEISSSLYPAGKRAEDGKLAFRINLLKDEHIASNGTFIDNSEAPLCTSDSCPEQNSVLTQYDAYNTDGQYYISIEKYESEERGVIAQVINMIRGYFFGNGDQGGGVIQDIFNSFVRNSDFVLAIRALLVLYIAYTGLSYMIGLAPITQQDGLVRLFKIAIIITLTSDNSWEFFNKYLFTIFTDGSLELIAKLTASAELDNSAISRDPSIMFDNFGDPLKIIFSSAVWKKLIGVGASSAVGLIIGVVVLYGMFKYFMNIARALIMYLISVMGMAVLLMIAPIFISFILFKYTKEMFDSWLKMLMSFLFQPLFLFLCLSMFNNLLLLGLQSVLSFTVCSACLVSLSDINIILIPFFSDSWDVCILPGYRMIDSSPWATTSNFGAIIFFFIIASSLQSFLDFSSKFANTVATGIYTGINVADVAPRSVISSIVGAAASSVGLDQASRRRRRDVRELMKQRGDTGAYIHDSLRTSAGLAGQMEKALSADGLSASQKLKIAEKYMSKASGGVVGLKVPHVATALAGLTGGSLGDAKTDRFKAVYEKASGIEGIDRHALQKTAIKMAMTTVNGGDHIVDAIRGDLFNKESLKTYLKNMDSLPDSVNLLDEQERHQFMDHVLKDAGFANEADRARIEAAYAAEFDMEILIDSSLAQDSGGILHETRYEVSSDAFEEAQKAATEARQAAERAAETARLDGEHLLEARDEQRQQMERLHREVEDAREALETQETQLERLAEREQAREEARERLHEAERHADQDMDAVIRADQQVRAYAELDQDLATAREEFERLQAASEHALKVEQEVQSAYELQQQQTQAEAKLQTAEHDLEDARQAMQESAGQGTAIEAEPEAEAEAEAEAEPEPEAEVEPEADDSDDDSSTQRSRRIQALQQQLAGDISPEQRDRIIAQIEAIRRE